MSSLPPSRVLLSSLSILLLAACTGGARETPGDEANPRLAELINESLDRHIGGMHGNPRDVLLPGAPEQARAWLGKLRAATTGCRNGPRDESRYNTFQYELVLADGTRIGEVPGHRRCTYEGPLPLIMQVTFEDGRAVQAYTDGRERRQLPDAALPDIDAFTLALLRVDQQRHPELYRPPAPTAAQIEEQWKR